MTDKLVLKIAGQEVIFEKGDLVLIPGVHNGTITEINHVLQSIRVGDAWRKAWHVRFANQTPENICANTLLDVERRARQLEDARKEAKETAKMFRALQNRQKKLEKSGLVPEAVRVQLKSEFPEMYSDTHF